MNYSTGGVQNKKVRNIFARVAIVQTTKCVFMENALTKVSLMLIFTICVLSQNNYTIDNPNVFLHIEFVAPCEEDTDCYGYETCYRYLSNANGYCVGITCNGGMSVILLVKAT